MGNLHCLVSAIREKESAAIEKVFAEVGLYIKSGN
jgi:hypothetical protein